MILSPLTELTSWGVFDRGVPNKERITLQNALARPVLLGSYCIAIGVRQGSFATPLLDQLFWFGDSVLPPKGWVFVYTGPGERREARNEHTGEPAIVFHWDRKKTVFQNPVLTPIVFRVSEVALDLKSTQDYLALDQKK